MDIIIYRLLRNVASEESWQKITSLQVLVRSVTWKSKPDVFVEDGHVLELLEEVAVADVDGHGQLRFLVLKIGRFNVTARFYRALFEP